METQEVKLPHHLSKIYKKMEAEGLIVDRKYVGEIPLAEYLESQDEGTETHNADSQEKNGPLEPNIKPETPEPSIPLSQVEAMMEKMLAEKMQSIETPKPQEQPRYQQQKKSSMDEYNIEDIPEFENWEVKDRQYTFLEGKPLTATIASKHTAEVPLQYYNKSTNKVHILRYSINQPSFFVENQSKEPGSVTTADIMFKWGKLFVPASEINLQKFLHIHPQKGSVFEEYDPLVASRKVVSDKKLRIAAENLVFTVGDMTNRAIASLEFTSYVDSWDRDIVEEEILTFAGKNPQKYIDYTEDTTIKMKGVIKASLASGELIWSSYRFLNKKREIILEVPKNQNEMDELVLYFESGIGRTTYEYLLNKL
jgi:hypothetical protein